MRGGEERELRLVAVIPILSLMEEMSLEGHVFLGTTNLVPIGNFGHLRSNIELMF